MISLTLSLSLILVFISTTIIFQPSTLLFLSSNAVIMCTYIQESLISSPTTIYCMLTYSTYTTFGRRPTTHSACTSALEKVRGVRKKDILVVYIYSQLTNVAQTCMVHHLKRMCLVCICRMI